MSRPPVLATRWLARAGATVCVLTIVASASSADGGRVVREKVHGISIEKTVTGESPDRWVSAYLPPSYGKAPGEHYPSLYLLHALGDADTVWMQRPEPYANIQDLMDRGIAEGRFGEMILIMPDERTNAGGGMYTNSAVTGRWEDFTVHDLVTAIDGKFRTLAQAKSRGIAGFSMGGHGAIKIGMKHPDVFSVVYGMSPAALGWGGDLSIDNPAFASVLRAESSAQLRGLYPKILYCVGQAFSPDPGRPPFYVDFPFAMKDGRLVPAEPAFSRWEENMPLYMVRRYQANLGSLRGLRFDTAWADEYTHIPLTTRALAWELTSLGIDHIFEEYNGDHRNRRWGRTGRLYTALLPYFWFLLEHDPVAANPGTKDDDLQAADLDQLQGEWQLESATRDGKEMPPEMRKLFKCVIQGDKFAIIRDGKSVEEGTLTLHATTKPKSIDFALSEGKQALGVYDVSRNTYKQCYAPPGKKRPSDFSAKEGSGASFSVWKRINKRTDDLKRSQGA